ncbi:uridine-cytidine kinase-like 1-like protein [Globomyces pollinis-pini]|nr:uridine-cytidine kinase-like 1-like protein [Globomyces pollinis-pini]
MKVEASGRLPWFDVNGNPIPPYIIGIAGGTASGKTSVSERIIKQLGVPWVALLCMDSFYKSLTKDQSDAAFRNEYNFDHPDAFDHDVLYETLLNLKKGIKVDIPIYDFSLHARLDETTSIYGANVIIFEGIFALYDKRVRDLMDLKLFVDTDADVRLSRRIRRDISERGRDLEGVIQQYNRFVKPSFDEHIFPTMKFADVIIPRGLDNTAAIDVMIKHVKRQLDERGVSIKDGLTHQEKSAFSSNVKLLPQTNQLKVLHTIIRDASTKRPDFVFYVDRLSRLLVEDALSQLPYEPITVKSPTQSTFVGKRSDVKVCGVCLVRGGASMELGLRKVIRDVPIGKVLIEQSKTREPLLRYVKLPSDISSRYIIITDSQCVTGASAMMAIRIVLEHNVPEDHIIYLTMVASTVGLNSITTAFPKIKVITSTIEEYTVEDNKMVHGGFGDFEDRYFGTVA